MQGGAKSNVEVGKPTAFQEENEILSVTTYLLLYRGIYVQLFSRI